MTRARFTGSTLALLSALVLPAMAFGQQGQAGEQGNQQADAQQANQQGNQQADAQQADAQQADQTEAERQQSEANDDQAKQRKQLKIFELEHRSPREISDLFRRYGGETTLTGRRTRGVAGAAGVAGAGRGAAGNRDAQDEQLLIATDEEQGLLFVRGTQERIEEVGKLLEAIDTPAGEMKKHQFRGVHLIPIHDGDVGRINNILSQLQIQSTIVNMGETSVIAFRDDSDDEESNGQLEQAERIISKLTEARQSSDSEQEQKPEENESDNGSDDEN